MQVRIRDVDVHYEEIGSGRPLLLLHGGGTIGCARWAMSIYEELFAHRTGWRRIYVDQMGHGETPMPAGLKNMDDPLEMTIAFMDAILPDQRYSIAGVSWGGYISRGLVHHVGERLDGAFIWDADQKYIDPDRVPRHVFRHEEGFDQLVPPDWKWLANMMIDETAASWAEVKRVIVVGGANNPLHQVFANPFTFDPDELSEPFGAPALILCGRQDNVTGYKVAFAHPENFPRGTVAVLDRCGHLTSVDQPVLLKALANEWLDRVEEFAGTR